MKKRHRFLWPILIVGATLVPVLLLHRYRAAHKWDVMVFWTVVTFVPVIKLSQRRWETVGFWVEITLIVALHLTVLAIAFSYIDVNSRLPFVLALPAIWVEIAGILRLLNVRESRYGPK
jgi:uncharacterized membrane protein YhaH (DUF805 family)